MTASTFKQEIRWYWMKVVLLAIGLPTVIWLVTGRWVLFLLLPILIIWIGSVVLYLRLR